MIRRKKITVKQLLLIIVLVFLVLATLLPFYMTILMSQKTNGEIINDFWAFPKKFHPEFFTEALKLVDHYIVNSIIIGTITVAGVLFLSSISGYVFARLDFGGKKLLFILLISLMMVPGILTLVPAFLWFKEFPLVGGNNLFGTGGNGFLNSRWVLFLPYVSSGQILGIFLCKTFFESLPESLFDAARIDGASEFKVNIAKVAKIGKASGSAIFR